MIAIVLNHCRPPAHTINYPQANYCTTDEINQAFYTNPADARDPHRLGKFKEEYKLINQVVHFNLNPQGIENHPSLKDGKLLYAFMQLDTVIDWSAFIFKQLIEFKANVSPSTRMPYPCLITKICRRHGVAGQKYLEKTRLEPGIINKNILTKSVTQSQVPRGVLGGSYLTTMPPRNANKTAWYKKLFCQGVSIMES